jgi:hypothetical protein
MGTTSFWMASANLYAPLPLPRLGFLGVYGDFGTFYNGNTINYAYNAGLGIRLSSIFGVYFPLLNSSNMGNLYSNYSRNIRLTLKFNPFSKPLSISGLGL